MYHPSGDGAAGAAGYLSNKGVRVLESVKSYHASRGVQVLELSRVIVQTKGVGVLESVKGYCALGFIPMFFRLRVHRVIGRIVIRWFIAVKDWDNNS